MRRSASEKRIMLLVLTLREKNFKQSLGSAVRPERHDARLLGGRDVVAGREGEVGLVGLITSAGEKRLYALGIGVTATHARSFYTGSARAASRSAVRFQL